MKTRDGYKMCYNLQTGVNHKNKMITYAGVFQQANDKNLLERSIEAQVDEIRLRPKEAVADKGYDTSSTILFSNDETSIYLPEKKEDESLKYDSENDLYICPKGNKLEYTGRNGFTKKREYKIYFCKNCEGCSIKKTCTTEKSRGRTKWRDVEEEKIQEFRRKMKTKKSKEKIYLRKQLVEHPFGTIKSWFGKLGFIVTGIKAVQTEVDLVTTAYNIKRLIKVENNQDFLFKQLEVYFNIDKLAI